MRIRAGLPISTGKIQITAIAHVSQCPLATRNTKDFDNIEGLALENPWQAA